MRILILSSLLGVTAVLGPVARSNAEILVGGQLLPISTPMDSSTDAVIASDGTAISITQQTSYPGLTLQTYSGSASATATPTLYRLETTLELQDYQRSNYVWTDDELDENGNPYTYIVTPALSFVQMTDTVTVTGGTGVYSLNYILGLDGLISSDNPLMGAWLQIALSIPEGVGQTTYYSFGPGDVIPSEVTLTYDELPFGGPVNPALAIYAYILPSPLYESDLEFYGNDLISGNASVRFGSTVTLNQLTATDANGNPIPGLSLSSSSNYMYPTDPNNLRQGIAAVPEPSTFTMFATMTGMGIAMLYRRNRMVKSAKRS